MRTYVYKGMLFNNSQYYVKAESYSPENNLGFYLDAAEIHRDRVLGPRGIYVARQEYEQLAIQLLMAGEALTGEHSVLLDVLEKTRNAKARAIVSEAQKSLELVLDTPN